MKLNWKQAVALGFGFAAIFLIWPVFNQFVPLFLQAGNPLVDEQLLLAGRYWTCGALVCRPRWPSSS
ncbi:MAG: hypothetical protein L0331_29850 [Chloroflexi bacterium]|nr:hypothetical protein [Chloroflexota bacterium]